MRKMVSIRDLKIGDVLEEAIKDSEGVVLVAKGTSMTNNSIIRLRRWFDNEDFLITIDSKNTKINPNDLDEVKDKSISYLKEVFSSSDDTLSEKLEQLDSVVGIMADGLEDISILPNDVLHLNHDQAGEHYYNVARLAMALASIYNSSVGIENKISLKSIGMAAFLHDYGKKYNRANSKSLRIVSSDCDDLENLDSINNEKPHQAYAYIMLRDKIETAARRMILFSSYNDTDLKNATSASDKSAVQAARIIKLCDTYDSMLKKLSIKNIEVENLINYLGVLANEGAVSEEYYNMFIDHFPMYSKGVKVLLSNDIYAVVVENNEEDLNKPIVLTLTGSPMLINLCDTTDISIKSIVKSSRDLTGNSEFMQSHLDKIHSTIEENDFISEVYEEEAFNDGDFSDMSFAKKITGFFARRK